MKKRANALPRAAWALLGLECLVLVALLVRLARPLLTTTLDDAALQPAEAGLALAVDETGLGLAAGHADASAEAAGPRGGGQGVYELVELPVHYPVYLVERQADTVVGHAALGEVIGADALVAHTGAHLALALGRALAHLPGALGLVQARGEDLHGPVLVLVLAALVLALHHGAGGQVRYAYGALRLVYVLASRAG